MQAILSAPEAAGPKIASLALWLGSFGTLICNYSGPMVNSILITRAPTRIDVVTPFVLGVLGFALFVVLMPLRAQVSEVAPSSSAQFDHLTWWFLVAAVLWAVVALNLVSTVAQIRATVGESPPELLALLSWCGEIVRKARLGSLGTSVTLLVMFLMLKVGPQRSGAFGWLPGSESLQEWQAALGLAYFGSMVGLITLQEQARAEMAASVSAQTHVEGPLESPGST